MPTNETDSPIIEPQESVMDQMIPIDGSWEGNSSEVTDHYRAIHEEANLNQELLKEKEHYLRQQQEMADGE